MFMEVKCISSQEDSPVRTDALRRAAPNATPGSQDGSSRITEDSCFPSLMQTEVFAGRVVCSKHLGAGVLPATGQGWWAVQS